MSEGWTRVGSTIYRGGLMLEGWTRVGSTVYKGGLMSEGWTRVGSTVYKGGLMSEVWTRVGSTIYKGGLMSEVWSRAVMSNSARGPNLAQGVIIFGPRDNFKCLLELARQYIAHAQLILANPRILC